MYPVLHFRPASDFTITVSPVVPSDIAAEVGICVRRAMHHISGVWAVSLDPGFERGRWRVELRGPIGHHIWTFAGTVDALPAMITDKVTAFLRSSTRDFQTRVNAQRLAADSLVVARRA